MMNLKVTIHNHFGSGLEKEFVDDLQRYPKFQEKRNAGYVGRLQ